VPGNDTSFHIVAENDVLQFGGIRLMITTPERTDLNHPSASLTRIEMKSPARTTVPAASPSTCRVAIFSTKREAHDYFLLKLHFGASSSGSTLPFWILRKIICDLVPRSAAFDIGVKLRPNSRIIVESSHANRHLRAIRPITTKQAGTTVYAKRFHSAFALSISFNQLFAF